MGFQDVAFLPSQASFHTTFLKNCGRSESLMTATYLKTMVVGRHGHTPCKIFLLQQIIFSVSVEFHRDHKTVT